MDRLKAALPHLVFPVAKSIFLSMTVNFGGRVVCHRHRDTNNLAYGICAVTPVGRFDYTRSGQLILEELRLVIEVPAACTAFIMSLCCTHSNLLLACDEIRFSFTQYAAGPIFRYVQNHCMTEKALKLVNPVAWQMNQSLKEEAWVKGVLLLPTIEGFIDYEDLYL